MEGYDLSGFNRGSAVGIDSLLQGLQSGLDEHKRRGQLAQSLRKVATLNKWATPDEANSMGLEDLQGLTEGQTIKQKADEVRAAIQDHLDRHDAALRAVAHEKEQDNFNRALVAGLVKQPQPLPAMPGGLSPELDALSGGDAGGEVAPASAPTPAAAPSGNPDRDLLANLPGALAQYPGAVNVDKLLALVEKYQNSQAGAGSPTYFEDPVTGDRKAVYKNTMSSSGVNPEKALSNVRVVAPGMIMDSHGHLSKTQEWNPAVATHTYTKDVLDHEARLNSLDSQIADAKRPDATDDTKATLPGLQMRKKRLMDITPNPDNYGLGATNAAGKAASPDAGSVKPKASAYKSKDAVVADYKAGKLKRVDAEKILSEQFGVSK